MCERNIWIKVLSQAIRDTRSKNNKIKERAIKWLTEGSKDFTKVCELANIDSDKIRIFFKKKFPQDREQKNSYKRKKYPFSVSITFNEFEFRALENLAQKSNRNLSDTLRRAIIHINKHFHV